MSFKNKIDELWSDALTNALTEKKHSKDFEEDQGTFSYVAARAKEAGKKKFTFQGKEYPVTIKTDIPEDWDIEEVLEFIEENNIDIDDLTDEEINEIGALGRALYRGAKKAAGRFTTSGRADAAEKKAAAAEKKNRDRERLKKAKERLKKAKSSKRESVDIHEESNTIAKVKEIASKKQAMKIDGVMVDMFTASAIAQIYDKVNDANKKKMDGLKITKLADLAMKMMKREEVDLDEAKDEPPFDVSKGDYAAAAKELTQYAKTKGGMDKDDFLSFANRMNAMAKKKSPSMLSKFTRDLEDLDTSPREKIVTVMRDHGFKITASRRGLTIEDFRDELDEAYKTPAEAKAYEDGKKAVVKKVSYDDNPHKKGSKEHTAWSKGHNDARAKLIAKRHTKEEIEEGKSSTGYELYHKDFSSAMKHAYDHAKKKFGIEIDPQEIDDKVASGPRKPSKGKTNSYRLMGKDGKKAVQIQVYGMDNGKYELNMYKEEVELTEAMYQVDIKGAGRETVMAKNEKDAIAKASKKMKVHSFKSSDVTVKLAEEVELDEMREPYAVVDTADGDKVVGTASDEKGAKSIITTSELPPMSIKNKNTLKIVKTRKKQKIGMPLKEEVELDEKNYEYKDGKVHISKSNFRKIHKDYKNATKGKERMVVLDPKTQQTVSAPVVFTEELSFREKFRLSLLQKKLSETSNIEEDSVAERHHELKQLAPVELMKLYQKHYQETDLDKVKTMEKTELISAILEKEFENQGEE